MSDRCPLAETDDTTCSSMILPVVVIVLYTALYAVVFILYAVLTVLCAVVFILNAVLTVLYAVVFYYTQLQRLILLPAVI